MIKRLQNHKVLILICFLALLGIVSGNISRKKRKILASQPSEQRIAQVRQIATQITVKILNQDSLGSGIIVQKQNNKYIVITNQHVLRAGEQPYKIQTFDGKIYSATVIPTQVSSRYDIALLEFIPQNNDYQTATLGRSSALQVGEPVFAVGFPYQYPENNSVATKDYSPDIVTGLAFTKGRISVILHQALEEGYQIGYTNKVQKGMSGGALLTIEGNLVGVNGKHAYPLWEAPDFFEDQSQPCPPLQELIIRSSLAIPLEKIIDAIPEVSWKSLDGKSNSSDTQDWSLIAINSTETNLEELIASMQAEALRSQNCEKESISYN